jgi:hypothetical protein
MGRKVLRHFNFSPAECRIQLTQFQELLKEPELSESKHILPFFEEHDHVSALIGMLNRSIGQIDPSVVQLSGTTSPSQAGRCGDAGGF